MVLILLFVAFIGLFNICTSAVISIDLEDKSITTPKRNRDSLPSVLFRNHGVIAKSLVVEGVRIPRVLFDAGEVRLVVLYKRQTEDTYSVMIDTILNYDNSVEWDSDEHNLLPHVLNFETNVVMTPLPRDTLELHDIKAVLLLGAMSKTKGIVLPESTLVDDTTLFIGYKSNSDIFVHRVRYRSEYTSVAIEDGLTDNSMGKYLVDKVEEAFDKALQNSSKLSPEFLDNYSGLSGTQFRHFLNNLGSLAGTRYLEVGIYGGSTMMSVLLGNENTLEAVVGIDNWDSTKKDALHMLLEKKQYFYDNLNSYKATFPGLEPPHALTIIEQSCWEVDIRELRSKLGDAGANVFLFDGPHEPHDQLMAIAQFLPALADQFVFIVDDWNWAPVREATRMGISMLSLKVLEEIEIFTTENPLWASLWHDGVGIYVVSK